MEKLSHQQPGDDSWWCVHTQRKEFKRHWPLSSSLFNVEGNIFFAVLASRLTRYFLINKYISTSVQKDGVPGIAGCLERIEIWSGKPFKKLRPTKRIWMSFGCTWLMPMDQCSIRWYYYLYGWIIFQRKYPKC